MLNNAQLMQEIREANLSYLMLAQHLIREDREQALYRLGISDEVADMIAMLTPAQVMKIAGNNMLICRMRFDDNMVWSLLLSHSGNDGKRESVQSSAIHAGILMASRERAGVALAS